MDRPIRRTTLQELDETDGLQGLTSKQYRFAIAMFSGLSHVAAYRDTYDCSGMADATIQGKASELAHHPLVTAKMRELRVKVDQQTTLAPYLSRELVLNGLLRLATSATKESVQLGAYIALGKTVGIDLFREVHVTERITRTPEDVDRELLDHINKLKPVLEGQARDVTPNGAAKIKPGSSSGRDRRRKPGD
jgi:hypothetical protein